MGAIAWGLLGPHVLASERRTRTLGLGATVRSFNDLAVPGLGGVWFGKQLLLATLGVEIAECVRDSGWRARNVEVANAVEALACWLALDSTGWKRDPRVRGALKLYGKKDLTFATVAKRKFYVTQPMRQATVQPLRTLGLVEAQGERFSAFVCTTEGRAFIDVACAAFRPYRRSVLDHLFRWACGSHADVTSPELREALSPIEAMPRNACEFLRERITQGAGTGARRRRKALEWVEALRGKTQRIAWEAKPTMLDKDHWSDMRAGSLFFTARDAAIRLLDEIESQIGNSSDPRMSLDASFTRTVRHKIDSLRQYAQRFLDENYDPSPLGKATAFCRECIEHLDARLLEHLVLREGHVLQVRGRDILPGVAFRGIQVIPSGNARSAEEDGAEAELPLRISLPKGISHRVRNLFLLNLDLRNELDNWLTASTGADGEQ